MGDLRPRVAPKGNQEATKCDHWEEEGETTYSSLGRSLKYPGEWSWPHPQGGVRIWPAGIWSPDQACGPMLPTWHLDFTRPEFGVAMELFQEPVRELVEGY